MLLGIGTGAAVGAALVYLAAHACYKGALFLTAGAVDHATGTRDVRALSGLRWTMPCTAAAAGVAALSMAGFPLLFGFVAKESLYTSLAGSGGLPYAPILLVCAIGASAMLGAAGLTAGLSPFFGTVSHRGAHEPAVLWL